MPSHKKVSGFTITLGAGGLRFKKRKSAYNVCIGKALEGIPGGGRNDIQHQAKFTSAAKACAGRKFHKAV
jgi:hypothetical protein